MFIGGSTFVFEKDKEKKQQLPTKYHKTIVTIKKYYVVTQVRKTTWCKSVTFECQIDISFKHIHTHTERKREEKKNWYKY